MVSGGVETTFDNLHEMFRKSVQVHGESPCLGSREILANDEVSWESFFFLSTAGSQAFYGRGRRKEKLNDNKKTKANPHSPFFPFLPSL